jgi:hypothetical protein
MLLAPAHKGAKLLPLVLESALEIKFGGIAVAGLKQLVPVFKDLEEGCPYLADLERRTEQALARNNPHLRARMVLSAEHDIVVNDLTFAQDPIAKEMKGQTHTSVCKPNLLYTKPVLKLMEIL